MPRKVKISCSADTFLPFTKIKDFQGELKSRTQEDVDHLIYSIDRHGFAFPFFVWKQPNGTCSCLDGHGRIMALTQMQREGYEIPELPVVYIEATDENDARTKLLHINVASGKYTDSGFKELVKDIPDLDLSDYNYPEIDLEQISKELGMLEKAQQNIEVTTDMTEVFDEVEYEPNKESGNKNRSLGSSGSGSNLSGSPSPTSDTNPPSDLPSVVGESSTLYGEEQQFCIEDVNAEEKEIVVCCPDCGETFIYKYK